MTVRRGGKAGCWVFLGFLLFAPLSLSADQRLQIRLPESGIVYWETQISEPVVFTLRHRNSIYDVWVEERFQTDPGGRIHLTAVRTPSPAVLEYYGLEEASADWIPLKRTFDTLRLLISSRGRVSLLFGIQEIPLSELLPDGTRIEVRVVETAK
jgi:hypothetical protein